MKLLFLLELETDSWLLFFSSREGVGQEVVLKARPHKNLLLQNKNVCFAIDNSNHLFLQAKHTETTDFFFICSYFLGSALFFFSFLVCSLLRFLDRNI